ncbi:NAD(P)H-binding protein, partial [Streptococcus suis]
DAVYFLAGSRGKDLLQTDAFGAVKLMQATEASQVKRFVLLSSIFATEPEKWSDPNLVNITDYNIAKFFADQWLIHNTTLDYTIVQPGNLVEAETGSGLIEL